MRKKVFMLLGVLWLAERSTLVGTQDLTLPLPGADDLFWQAAPQKALETYQTLLEKNGDSLELCLDSATLLEESGRSAEAQRVLEACLQRRPGNPELLSESGQVSFGRGNFDQARRNFADAMRN
ncbi:MAG: hypothetical protein HY548_00595, partial [Elusimicrobia bacterium]|nr:hypothetical protein [Elusimicrobiota bacterium]